MKKSKILSSKLLFYILSLLLSLSIWIYITSVITVESTKTFQNVQIELVGEETIQRMYDLVVTDLDTTTVNFDITGPKRIVNSMDAADIIAQVDVGRLSHPGTTTLNYTIVYPSGVDRRDLKVSGKSRDSVTFIVSKQVSKTIPVRGGFEGKTVSGFIQETPVFEPSTITISGPEVYVQEVDHAYVTFGKEQNLSSTYSLDTGFSLMDKDDKLCPSDYIVCSQDTVHATLPVLVVREIPLTIGIEEGAGATKENTRITIEPATIKLAGDSSVLDGMNSITLNDTIDLTTFKRLHSATYSIPLPNSMRNLSGVSEVTVTIEITGLETQELNVSKGDIQFRWTGVPENMEVVVENEKIPVLLRGPSGLLETVKASEIVAEGDVSSFAENADETELHFVKVSISVPSVPGVGAIQDQSAPTYDYTVAIRLVEKEKEENP